MLFTDPDSMEKVRLRLPHVAELFWLLKNEDGLAIDSLPLSIGEARQHVTRIVDEINKPKAL